ncbi:MAG: GNAT family N-acetyltransferase [Clostridia bacterium]|nr:GNAT family N-acetyltransferase [Clostridia bacterium]
MKRVDRYETISALISKQIRKGVKTNNFLTENDLKIEIENNSLYYYEYDGGLLILRDRTTHYILNYYINDITKNIEKIFEKDVVVEIVSRPNNNDNEVIKYFEKQNFACCIERVRYAHTCDEIVDNDTADAIQLCKTNDAEKVYEILKENFDSYTGCIPTKERLIKDVENGNVYIYKDENIKGILHIDKSKISSEIKHLIVVENEREKGIATKLINKYFNEVNAKKKTVWTGKENNCARKFYEKCGYELDGYTSVVLKKKG